MFAQRLFLPHLFLWNLCPNADIGSQLLQSGHDFILVAIFSIERGEIVADGATRKTWKVASGRQAPQEVGLGEIFIVAKFRNHGHFGAFSLVFPLFISTFVASWKRVVIIGKEFLKLHTVLPNVPFDGTVETSLAFLLPSWIDPSRRLGSITTALALSSSLAISFISSTSWRRAALRRQDRNQCVEFLVDLITACRCCCDGFGQFLDNGIDRGSRSRSESGRHPLCMDLGKFGIVQSAKVSIDLKDVTLKRSEVPPFSEFIRDTSRQHI